MLKMSSTGTNASVVCITHELRHWSHCSKPRQTFTLLQFINIINFHLLKLLLHFHPQFFSQPGLDLDRWGPQVWWNESGCLPFQKADCLTGSSYLSQQGFCCKFAAESNSERIFNIGQHLPELCLGQKRRQLVTLPNKKCLFVKMHPV